MIDIEYVAWVRAPFGTHILSLLMSIFITPLFYLYNF